MARRSPISVHIPDLSVSPPRHHDKTSPMPVVLYDRNGNILDTIVLAHNSVDFHADLPAADLSNNGQYWIVRFPSGTYLLLTKKRAGTWYSDGVTWRRLGENRVNDNITTAENTWSASKINTFLGTYTHTQATAAATWNINHSLGRFPSVTIVDGSGVVCEADVSYFDSNNIIIIFNSNQSGKVYLN